VERGGGRKGGVGRRKHELIETTKKERKNVREKTSFT